MDEAREGWINLAPSGYLLDLVFALSLETAGPRYYYLTNFATAPEYDQSKIHV